MSQTHWKVVGAVSAHHGVLILQLQLVSLALTVTILMLQPEKAELLVELQEPQVLLLSETSLKEKESNVRERDSDRTSH